MSAEATLTTQHEEDIWESGKEPFNASYGKLMMWYFLVSDTFTFAAFLIAYAATRFANLATWPTPSAVFKGIPLPHSWEGLNNFFHTHELVTGHGWPLVFVSFMTFVLILSSVTMVRAVQEGIQMNKWGVVKWLIPTIIGGMIFMGCQYLEWTHLFAEDMNIFNGQYNFNPFSNLGHVHDTGVWGPNGFAMFFFAITGFHGLHVLVGILLNVWLLFSTINNRFEKVGHYEMVEKVGLFWHFVDLVWVYVFLSYYLL